jgi:hypothetical protein
MKKIYLFILLLPVLLSSCNVGNPPAAYVYNANPLYTKGYVQFYGAEYAKYNNSNNVLSVSLFSDSLKINSEGALEGTGQYLFLEDVYIAPTDTMLSVQTYTVSDSREPYTVEPGKNDTVDALVFPIGASISYYEENTSKSKVKFIKSGTFTVTKFGSFFNITCNFVTDDKKVLTGSFNSFLPHINESLQASPRSVRKRIHQYSHF